eukprot:jgi/Mesvir1/18753/Mv01259-RA.1
MSSKAAVDTKPSEGAPSGNGRPFKPFSTLWPKLALCALSLAPLVIPVDTNLNIIATASLTVYIGAHVSVKPVAPTETMSKHDAMRFPFIGSAVLLGLFLLFKLFKKDLVNLILTSYFLLLGTVSLTVLITPLVAPRVPHKELGPYRIVVPIINKELVHFDTTLAQVIACGVGLALCLWYSLTKFWLSNNLLGLAFSIQGIENLSLGSFKIGCILLGGLFVYDIFWVFFTPVMVSVARSFDAPIKLLFPSLADPERPFSMLGLGDIVIPGMFVALILRFDASRGSGQRRYFWSAMVGYVGGLLTTVAVMNYFKAAQPALLYLVPGVIGCVVVHCLATGELPAPCPMG